MPRAAALLLVALAFTGLPAAADVIVDPPMEVFRHDGSFLVGDSSGEPSGYDGGGTYGTPWTPDTACNAPMMQGVTSDCFALDADYGDHPYDVAAFGLLGRDLATACFYAADGSALRCDAEPAYAYGRSSVPSGAARVGILSQEDDLRVRYTFRIYEAPALPAP